MAREMYNKLAQRCFGLLGGLSPTMAKGDPEFLFQGPPLIVIEDPNDDIIIGLSSFSTYISAHLKDVLFSVQAKRSSQYPQITQNSPSSICGR